jgi:hypothetical protein
VKSGRRSRLIAVVAALAAIALLAACGTNEPTAEPTHTGPTEELTVTVADGNATPSAERVEVKVGTIVEITVTSDAEDVLHVHGYDKELTVVPSTPRTLTFLADQTGRFEIEFHELDKLVYQLVVTP